MLKGSSPTSNSIWRALSLRSSRLLSTIQLPTAENQMELQKRADLLAQQTFLGVPSNDFAKGVRDHFVYLLKAGLNPDSKVVDLGCGVLRVGYWLIHFLDPGCYCGIEHHAGRL